MNNQIVKYALIGAGITTGWIAIVVSIIFNSERLFGGRVPEEHILIPIAMLLLFVVSAAITGMAVFGRPIMWYLDGKKNDAVLLAVYTIAALVAIGILILIFLLLA